MDRYIELHGGCGGPERTPASLTGSGDERRSVHHDQGPVFTSYAWVKELLRKDGVKRSSALRGARDNPEMESFFGRSKVENHSLLLDAQTLEELPKILSERIRYYNRERRHSSLGNRAPDTFIRSLAPES